VHTLHIIQADIAKPARVARGIRDALRSTGDLSDGDLLQEVERVLGAIKAGGLPIGLVSSEDMGKVMRAADALSASSGGSAVAGIDMNADDLDNLAEAAQAAHEPETPSADDDAAYITPFPDDVSADRAAQHTALVLLSQSDGNVGRAFALARTLARTSGSIEHYAQVCRLYVTAFAIEFAG
jgi:hypothetical protein